MVTVEALAFLGAVWLWGACVFVAVRRLVMGPRRKSGHGWVEVRPDEWDGR